MKKATRQKGFRVTILRDGEAQATYEIRELIRADAEERAWKRYEAEHGSVLFDRRYGARAEEL